MPTYHDPEDGDPTVLAQLEANAVIMENEYGQSDDVDYEGELVTDYPPVLVYRTPDMTDDQAKAIQNFVHEVMTRA